MLSAASKSSTKLVVQAGALFFTVVALFALLLQLVMGLAAAPVPGQVTGSFGTNRSADYTQSSERTVPPQRRS